MSFMANVKISKGSSRCVILVGKLAFKFPYTYSWKTFLNGLLANMQEVEFSQIKDWEEKLCPIKWYIPLGFLVIMPRVKVLEPHEMTREQLEDFCQIGDFKIPAEIKESSFGWLEGRLVAIDYG